MLLKTHKATALCIALHFDFHYFLHAQIYFRLCLYGVAFLFQDFIDTIGHTGKRYGKVVYPARNKYHSLGAMLLMASTVGAIAFLISKSLALLLYFYAITLVHWVEDLVTEGGVLLYRSKIKLPFHLSYNDPTLNRITILIFYVGVLLSINPLSSLSFFLVFVTVSVYVWHAFLSL